MATTQKEKSQSLMNYQNLRGGNVELHKITAPTNEDWGNGIEAMSHALEMEKSINQVIFFLFFRYKMATRKKLKIWNVYLGLSKHMTITYHLCQI